MNILIINLNEGTLYQMFLIFLTFSHRNDLIETSRDDPFQLIYVLTFLFHLILVITLQLLLFFNHFPL